MVHHSDLSLGPATPHQFVGQPHAQGIDEILRALAADRRGLSGKEAASRLQRHGLNRLPEAKQRSPVLRFVAHFQNVLIYVLLGSAGITAGLGPVGHPPGLPRAPRWESTHRFLPGGAAGQRHLGAGLEGRGTPRFEATVVGASVRGTTLGGYSLIRAGSLDAAVVMARDCPLLPHGGAVEICELSNHDERFDNWLDAAGDPS